MDSRKTFTAWVHRFGIASSAILLVLMTAFPFVVSIVFGIWPNWSTIWPAMLSVILILAPFWPAEYFGYMMTMGPGALYLSYITGNVTNLRMPATVGTMNSLGLEPNTDECHTMAIIACGASNITTLSVLFLGLLFSVSLQPILQSEVLQPAFNQALPALFGGLVAQSIFKTKKQAVLYLVPLAVCLMFCYLTPISSAYYLLATVFVGAITFYFLDYRMSAK